MRRVIVCAGALLGLAGCGSNSSDKSPDNGAPQSTVSAPGDTATNTPAAPSGGSAGMGGQDTSQTNPAAPQTDPMNQGSAMNTTPTQTKPTTMMDPPKDDGPMGIPPPDGFHANAMDECGLHTQWPGDEFCILPPPADKGFQLHIGPSSYDNPEPQYVLQPGQETTTNYQATAGNDKDIYFYVRQYRMRPGAHHTIVRDTSNGRRLSGSDVNQDHPVGGITAPENEGIGIPLAAHQTLSVDHHAINIRTDQALLQEVWVNFWYIDASKVKEATNLLYDPGGSVMETVAPGADVVLGPYGCDITAPGRLISMFGHVHANNVRFSAWRNHAGKRDLIYESYHWEDPLWLEFTSLAKNPMNDAANMIDGGWTGILDLAMGDSLEWECHEVNTQQTALTFTNETFTGQMCIIIGDLVGSKCMNRSGFVFDPTLE